MFDLQYMELSQKFIIGALFLVQLLGAFSVKMAHLIVPNSQVITDLIIEPHEGSRTERASAWEHRDRLVRADSGASSTLLSVAVERRGEVVCVLLGLFAGGLFLTLTLPFLHHVIKIISESLPHIA